MFQGLSCSTVALGMGVFCLFRGLPIPGALFVLIGIVVLGMTWRDRYLLPPDPEFQSYIDQWLSIATVDGAAAEEARSRIFAAAAKWEAHRLSQLRTQALIDRRAAAELRNRLREKLYISTRLRHSVERALAGTPGIEAILHALDRDADITRQRCLEAEQFLQ